MSLHAMACLKLRHVCLTVVLFSIGISSCRGQGGGGAGGGGAVVPGTQDAIQIVAQAALCFDNRQVINGCLQSMGINVTTTTGGSGATTSAPAAANGSAAATMCSAPCFGQMTMMMGCVNGIFGNFAGYSPGLMQGVQAVFQMACGNVNGQGGAAAAAGGGGGGSAGASGGSGGAGGGAGGATGGGAGSGNASPNSGSHVAVKRPGYPTSGAAGPTVSLTRVFSSLLIVWAGTRLMA
ncbi:glycine-rich cell wall structural protein 1-like [Oryza glaberrima]|uniref:glycine-rich cell wall structural protein 1-like n=1 Tax=Oryza glaberrima TaxID=4538 RepID=UPI00224C3B53|nr:glycine-rich cell wall structural protein 1-like [Oryza glaberrima]